MVVGDDLVHDAVDRLGGGICCRRGEDVDRNRGQTDFARRDGSTLPVADLHHTVVAANRGDGHQDTVFGDAVEERLVEVGVFADIVADLQTGRIDVLQLAKCVLADRFVGGVGGGGGVSHG